MSTKTSSPLAHRDFRLVQMSRLLVTIAIHMQSVAVGWQVYELTGQPLSLGWVGLAQFIPAFLLAPFSGHVADRFDRRNIVVACEVAFAVSTIVLTMLSADPMVSPAPIYVVLVGFGIGRAFAGPAHQALTPSLVPAEQLAGAIAWSSSVWQVATIAGPAVGGLVYAVAGKASTVFAVSTVMYLASAALMAAIERRPPSHENRGMSLESLSAGLKFVWKEKTILGAISLDLFAVLFGGAVALLPAYARDILHVGPMGLGALRSAPAVGALVVALALAHRPLRRKAGPLMLFCVAIFGVATIVFGLSRNFFLSLLALVIVGGSDMVSVVVRQVLVQAGTPETMRGRVSAVNLVFVGASNELGEFESGVTAALLGLVPSVVLGGVGTLLVVATWAIAFPALRRVDALHGVRS